MEKLWSHLIYFHVYINSDAENVHILEGWMTIWKKNKAFRERQHPSAPRSVNE